MAESTNISYVHHTFNPWRGCAPVSPGCTHCYAAALGKSVGIDAYGKGKPRIRTKDWKKPLRWNARIQGYNNAYRTFRDTLKTTDAGMRANGHEPTPPDRVLVSLCDWLDDEVPIEWLADFLKLIHGTTNLNWLLLTKRPENWEPRITKARDFLLNRGDIPSGFWCQVWWAARRQVGPLRALPPANIWLGVSCEDQQRADERIPLLLNIPAKVRWVSFEPLLEDMDIQSALGHNYGCGDAPAQSGCAECGHLAKPVDWVVIGGESGPKFRDCGVESIENVARQAREAKVPTYVKQDAGRIPGLQGRIPDEIWRLKEFPKTI